MKYKEAISHLRNEIVNATGTLAALPPEAEEVSSLKYHIEALEIAVEALGKERWIPTTERLPENGEHILISFENFGEATIALYKEDDEGGAFYGSTTGPKFVSYGLFVNAWMPLPAPYREEQEDA